MPLDRRDPEYWEQLEGRRHGTREDFAAGRIGEATFRASMALLGLTADEIYTLVQEYRPFRTVGDAAAGFVSGLPRSWRDREHGRDD